MSSSGRLALPDVREGSGGPSGCPAVVGRPSRLSVSGERPFRMTESGQDSLLDVW